MAAPDLVNLASLIDDAKCFALVRQQRWPEGVRCPGCGSSAVVRHGGDDTQPSGLFGSAEERRVTAASRAKGSSAGVRR